MTDLKGEPKKIESEKLIERKLVKWIKNLGGLSIKLVATYFTGLPDRMILLPEGRIFFCEVKTTGKVPTAIQRRVHDAIRALGFRVHVIDCSEDLELMIKNEIKREC